MAPQTTLDLDCGSLQDIPVEMRKSQEVKGAIGHFGQIRWAPKNAETINPAFDLTPANLVTGYIIDDKLFGTSDVQSGVLKTLV